MKDIAEKSDVSLSFEGVKSQIYRVRVDLGLDNVGELRRAFSDYLKDLEEPGEIEPTPAVQPAEPTLKESEPAEPELPEPPDHVERISLDRLSDKADPQACKQYYSGLRKINWDIVGSGALIEREKAQEPLRKAAKQKDTPLFLLARGTHGSGKSAFLWQVAAARLRAGSEVYRVYGIAGPNIWHWLRNRALKSGKQVVALVDQRLGSDHAEPMENLDGRVLVLLQDDLVPALKPGGSIIEKDLTEVTGPEKDSLVRLFGRELPGNNTATSTMFKFAFLMSNPADRRMKDIVQEHVSEFGDDPISSRAALLCYAHLCVASIVGIELPVVVLNALLASEPTLPPETQGGVRKFATDHSKFIAEGDKFQNTLVANVDAYAEIALGYLKEQLEVTEADLVGQWFLGAVRFAEMVPGFVPAALRRVHEVRFDWYRAVIGIVEANIHAASYRTRDLTGLHAWWLFYTMTGNEDLKADTKKRLLGLHISSESEARKVMSATRMISAQLAAWLSSDASQASWRYALLLPKVRRHEGTIWLGPGVLYLFRKVVTFFPTLAPERRADTLKVLVDTLHLPRLTGVERGQLLRAFLEMLKHNSLPDTYWKTAVRHAKSFGLYELAQRTLTNYARLHDGEPLKESNGTIMDAASSSTSSTAETKTI